VTIATCVNFPITGSATIEDHVSMARIQRIDQLFFSAPRAGTCLIQPWWCSSVVEGRGSIFNDGSRGVDLSSTARSPRRSVTS